MSKAFLKRKIAIRIANGHPWIFANEVEKIEGNPEPGEIVAVFYFDGKFWSTLFEISFRQCKSTRQDGKTFKGRFSF